MTRNTDARYQDSTQRFLTDTSPAHRNFQCPAGLIAFVARVEPSSEATLALAQMESLCIRTIKAGAPAQNPTLTHDAMVAIRQREAAKANTGLDAIEAKVTAYAATTAAKRERLTAPPPPKDAIEAARHAEIRMWYTGLGQTERLDAIQRAVNPPPDPELLAALYHAPRAFQIVADRTRNLVLVSGFEELTPVGATTPLPTSSRVDSSRPGPDYAGTSYGTHDKPDHRRFSSRRGSGLLESAG